MSSTQHIQRKSQSRFLLYSRRLFKKLTRVTDFFRFGGKVFSTVESVVLLLRLRLLP